MSSAQRDTHCTDTLVKFAIPQFLLLVKEAAHELALPLPLDLETKIFLTSLGTGQKPAVSFLQRPTSCWSKFTTLKTDYTKGPQAHFDMGPQTESEFESGKNSEDYMMKLLEHMWTLSTEYKTATAQDLTGGRSRRGAQRTVPPDGSTVDVSAATAASQRPTKHGVEVVPSVGVSDGGGGAGTGTHGGEPDGLKPTCDCGKECILRDAGGKGGRRVWECANPNVLDECSFSCYADADAAESANGSSSPGASSTSGGEADAAESANAKDQPEMPDGWIFSHILMACAWSPWSGKTPSEWKGLCASGGKVKALKQPDRLNTESNPLTDPTAMAAAFGTRKMLSSNGESTSRRQSEAAVKIEAERARRVQRDKDNMDHMKEAEVTRKAGVTAMEKANVNAEEMTGHLKQLVRVREAEFRSAKRARKIQALEKRCALAGGRNEALNAQLDKMLAEGSDNE